MIEDLGLFERYRIWRATGPFAEENNPLYVGFYALGWIWGEQQNIIADRFSYANKRRGFENAEDIAYIAVDPKGVAVADVTILSDSRFPQLGLHSLVHTHKEHRGKGLCRKLFGLSVDGWFGSGGEKLVLHTESEIAHDTYEKAGYQDWYGDVPSTNDFSESGIMMLHGDKDPRDPEEIVTAYFDGSGELTTRELTMADSAQFLMFGTAYQAGLEPDADTVYENVPIEVPSLNVIMHWIPEARFNYQFLYPNPHDVLLALVTEHNKLVGVGGVTYANEALGREGEKPFLFVHPNYERGIEMLKDDVGDRTGFRP